MQIDIEIWISSNCLFCDSPHLVKLQFWRYFKQKKGFHFNILKFKQFKINGGHFEI